MNDRKPFEITNTKILVTTKELQEILSCGRHTAEQISRDAGARVKLGKSIRHNLKRIQPYIDSISEASKVI